MESIPIYKKIIEPAITKSLTILINQVLHVGVFPDKLKIAKVIPIYKKVTKEYLEIIDLNSIQFNLFPAHINISYNIDNVHIMCRKRGGLKTVLMNVHPQTLTVVNY